MTADAPAADDGSSSSSKNAAVPLEVRLDGSPVATVGIEPFGYAATPEAV